MMSEQQFEVFQECEYLEEWSSCPYCIKYDGETVFETLPLGIAKEVCKKLNETLPLGIAKEVCKKLNEQQDTIRKLQDLCGESDGENAKLRIENKRLEEENEQLKQKLENLGLNEKNDMVEYSIEDFFRWLQRIKKEFEDFEDNGD